MYVGLETGSWKLEVGSWELEVGNCKYQTSWILEGGNWKLEIGSDEVNEPSHAEYEHRARNAQGVCARRPFLIKYRFHNKNCNNTNV